MSDQETVSHTAPLSVAFRIASGRIDPNVRPFQLWDEMYEVWRRLDGPVVNPTMVRES